ncbi:MAG: hypothetical protein E7517_05110 [Ruminococcaceae bacterium]|nr:hypothetical protein [Oscillospiraceae bacterium]
MSVKNILENAKGNKYDIYYTLCSEIVKSASPYEELMNVLEFNNRVGNDDDLSSFLSDEEIQKIESKYFGLINEIVVHLTIENPSKELFYKKLYENIFESNLFSQNDKCKTIYLKLLSENILLIPYYYADNLLVMDDTSFRDSVDRIKPYIFEALHMLNRDFESFTELSSQLKRIEEKIDNDNEKRVFWAVIIRRIMDTNMDTNN